MEVTSEEEYSQFTAQLVEELLRECSPEHIAVIAAQHMMYSDLLARSLDECRQLLRAKDAVSDARSELFQAKFDALTRDWAKYMVIALDAYKRKAWGAGGKAKSRRTNEMRPKLMREWEETGHEYASRIDFARIVSRREGGIQPSTVREWIKEHERSKA